MRTFLIATLVLLSLPALADDVCKRGQSGALRKCQNLCNDGDFLACTELGVMHFQGTDRAANDPTRAVAHWSKACRIGEVEACAWLAHAKTQGRGVPRDVIGASKDLDKACQAGLQQGCVWLGVLFLEGIQGLSPDPNRSRDLFEKSCKSPEKIGCVELGRMHETGVGKIVSKDPKRSLNLYMDVCKGPDVRGCGWAGRLHERGLGTRKDLEAAVALYERGCSQNNMRACVELGRVSRDGLGRPADVRKAAALFSKACQAYEQHGCVLLGWMKNRGLGEPRPDPIGAMNLFMRACDAGEAEGCGAAGYLVGRGSNLEESSTSGGRKIPKHPAEADALLNRACAGGHSKSCRRMKEKKWREDVTKQR